MSYDFRDLLFDLGKEALKDYQIECAKKYYSNFRIKVSTLPKEDIAKGQALIDKLEEQSIAQIRSQAEVATAAKDTLKQLGF